MSLRGKVERLRRRVQKNEADLPCRHCGQVGDEDMYADCVLEDATADEQAEVLDIIQRVLDQARRFRSRETFCECGRVSCYIAFLHCLTDRDMSELERVFTRYYDRTGRPNAFVQAREWTPAVVDYSMVPS